MDKTTALEIVGRFKSALEKTGVKARRIIIFGSYATDTYRENSDIDVLVVSESFRGMNHWERIELMTDALYELFQPIEARALTPEEWESSDSLTATYVKSSPLITV